MASRKIDWTKRIYRRRLAWELGEYGDKLPASLQGRFLQVPVYADRTDLTPWAHLTIVVKESEPTFHPNGQKCKSSKHRTFVECRCGQLIPTGRYHQHAPACTTLILVSGESGVPV